MMARSLRAVRLLAACLWLAGSPVAADVLGQVTGLRDAATAAAETVEAAAWGEYVSGEGRDFFENHQDRLSTPWLYAAYALSDRATLDAAWDYRFVDDERTGRANGPGDLRLAVQVQIQPASWRTAAIAARIGVKLPNADETVGLGTNETDTNFSLLLATQLAPHWRLLMDTGLEILGDPREGAVQDDLLHLAAGIEGGAGGWLVRAGVAGREASNNGNDNLRITGAALHPITHHLAWLVGGQTALGGLAADWGVEVGFAWHSRETRW